MSTRNLEHFFHPKSIAVVGATNRPQSVGATVIRNLLGSDFAGPVMPVNPKYSSVGGVLCYPSIDKLPLVPDLAVICTPAQLIPQLITDLGERGARAVIVLSTTPAPETNESGQTLEQAMLEAARPYLLRLLGPNSLGLLVPQIGLNASFSQINALSGKVALIHQSGMLCTAMLDWAYSNGIGFSHFISLGDSADVDFGDMLDYLGSDPDARAILLHIESIRDARKFMSAARAAARNKPVLVIKTGRVNESARMIRAQAVTDDRVFNAAIERAGMLRVFTVDEMFDAVETLAHAPSIRGERLAIMANGIGLGLVATDDLITSGGRLAELSPPTLAKLNAILPSNWSHGNPVDILGNGAETIYGEVLETLLRDSQVNAVLVLHAPHPCVSSEKAAQAVIEATQAAKKGVLTSWLGGHSMESSRQLFSDAGVPTYATPDKAVRAFMHLVRYRRNQDLLMETPPSLATAFSPHTARARAVIDLALQEGRLALDERETREVLAAYGISLSSAGRLQPETTVSKCSIQEMARRSAHELLIQVRNDPVFGPVIVFGQGGTAAALSDDRAVALPPLNVKLARELISRTQVAQSLEGKTAMAAIELTLLQVSQLIIDIRELVELNIDPLLVDQQGVQALEAWIRLQPAVAVRPRRLAIRPYPRELEESVVLRSGLRVLLRPIRPEDEARHYDFRRQLTAEDLYYRFFLPTRRDIPHSEMARLTQIDYDREMAFIATVPDERGEEETLGIVRTATDPNNITAEFAIIIRSDLKGQGLGQALLGKMINYCRNRGTEELVGFILPENRGMQNLAKRLGFDSHYDIEQEVIEIRFRLQAGS